MHHQNMIGLIGARGGQGTSTVAAVIALHSALNRPTGLIGPNPSDLAAVVGAAGEADEQLAVSATLMIARRPLAPPALNIVDCGTLDHPTATEPPALIVVMRGPCYLALRTVVRHRDRQLAGIILVREADRSITPSDVIEATALPVLADISVSEKVARVVDAGLLGGRSTAMPELAPLRVLSGRLPSFAKRRSVA